MEALPGKSGISGDLGHPLGPREVAPGLSNEGSISIRLMPHWAVENKVTLITFCQLQICFC